MPAVLTLHVVGEHALSVKAEPFEDRPASGLLLQYLDNHLGYLHLGSGVRDICSWPLWSMASARV